MYCCECIIRGGETQIKYEPLVAVGFDLTVLCERGEELVVVVQSTPSEKHPTRRRTEKSSTLAS